VFVLNSKYFLEKFLGLGYSSVVECLSSMNQALGLIHSTAKKKCLMGNTSFMLYHIYHDWCSSILLVHPHSHLVLFPFNISGSAGLLAAFV
jgi:hypothetical protein